MMRTLSPSLALLALLALVACTPEPPPAPPAPDDTEIREQTHAEQSSMTLSVREVTQPGWHGRLVEVTFSAGAGRHVRVLPSARPAPLREIVAEASPPQPYAAIDGGFYDTRGEPMGLVRAGGADIHAVGEQGGSGIFLVEGNVPRIVHRDAYAPSERIPEALQSIDRLVNAGSSVVSPTASERRAARSAIAIDARGGLHLVIAFDERAVAHEEEARIELGPDATRSGPTIAQWAQLLRRPVEEGGVGARDALGLDGGFSTSLVVKSEARALSVVAHNATINGLLITVH